MLELLLSKLQNHIVSSKPFRSYNSLLEDCITILNSEKILAISGLRFSGKIELVGEMVRKTHSENNFFYFNPYIDVLGTITSKKDLILLLDYRIRVQWDVKIIILEDCNGIKDIKSLILELYNSKNFKIIILWNNIKIEWIKEIQLSPLSLVQISSDLLPYGWLPHVRIAPDKAYKKILLSAFLSQILEKEVFRPYNIKNQENFRSVLAFLASHETPISLRELQRVLEENNVSISLITLIEYVHIALTTRILYKQEVYNIKESSQIQSKALYLFSDLGIRSILSDFEKLRYNNIIANEFLQKWYNIYLWKFWVFMFDLYAHKWEEKIGITISYSEDKIEIRKLARKLAKVPSLSSRYVLVPDISKLGMRKLQEQGVLICELYEVFESINYIKK